MTAGMSRRHVFCVKVASHLSRLPSFPLVENREALLEILADQFVELLMTVRIRTIASTMMRAMMV